MTIIIEDGDASAEDVAEVVAEAIEDAVEELSETIADAIEELAEVVAEDTTLEPPVVIVETPDTGSTEVLGEVLHRLEAIETALIVVAEEPPVEEVEEDSPPPDDVPPSTRKNRFHDWFYGPK